MTVRTRGGGKRKIWRKVNFGQEKMGVKGEVTRIDYDPNRTAYLALVDYEDETKGYVLAPQGISIGDELVIDDEAPVKEGNRMRLTNIPVGTQIHNISLNPNGEGKMVRAAGSSAVILAQEGKHTHLKMPSKEVRKVNNKCFASIGELSNPEHKYENIGKAGRNRNKGRRPVVRGKAKNAVDHPHGGGEGGSTIGLKHPKTPTGKPAKGVKTRKRKHTDKYIIRRRNSKK
jgi:large subunit ribosomal protein L2